MSWTTPRRKTGTLKMIYRATDKTLLAAVGVLVALGSVLVWAATRQRLLDQGGDGESFLKKNLINIVIGVIVGLVVAVMPHHKLRAQTPLIYFVTTMLLAATLVVGTTINGANSWIVLGGGFQLQPSEFSKVALVLTLAALLSRPMGAKLVPGDLDVVRALTVAAIPMGLILLQPDLGTILVFASVILGVLLTSGSPKRWVIGLVIVGLCGGFAAVQLGMLKEYQIKRFTAFLDPSADPRGVGYNTNQSRIAIGSGQLTGSGLFEGSQTKGGFVPEQQTDFIFTVAGEELGFIGAGGVIIAMWIILWRGMRIAARAPDMFGRLAATGVVVWFAFQAFENIGMTMSLMPVTGLPLPFVSYGGSAMMANMAAIGLLQNIHVRTKLR